MLDWMIVGEGHPPQNGKSSDFVANMNNSIKHRANVDNQGDLLGRQAFIEKRASGGGGQAELSEY